MCINKKKNFKYTRALLPLNEILRLHSSNPTVQVNSQQTTVENQLIIILRVGTGIMSNHTNN